MRVYGSGSTGPAKSATPSAGCADTGSQNAHPCMHPPGQSLRPSTLSARLLSCSVDIVIQVRHAYLEFARRAGLLANTPLDHVVVTGKLLASSPPPRDHATMAMACVSVDEAFLNVQALLREMQAPVNWPTFLRVHLLRYTSGKSTGCACVAAPPGMGTQARMRR